MIRALIRLSSWLEGQSTVRGAARVRPGGSQRGLAVVVDNLSVNNYRDKTLDSATMEKPAIGQQA